MCLLDAVEGRDLIKPRIVGFLQYCYGRLLLGVEPAPPAIRLSIAVALWVPQQEMDKLENNQIYHYGSISVCKKICATEGQQEKFT